MNVSISHPTDRPNFTIVYIGDLTLAFSYRTIVGITPPGEYGMKVRENEWGPTTGKHLNYLDARNKTERLSSEEFAKVLEGLGTLGLVEGSQ